jgi:hypothetical protein
MHAGGEGFDGAKRSRSGCVMHRAASLPVFLVIDVKSCCVCLAKDIEWGRVRDDLTILKETNILAAELDGASTCAGQWHGVLAWAKQKEEGKGE